MTKNKNSPKTRTKKSSKAKKNDLKLFLMFFLFSISFITILLFGDKIKSYLNIILSKQNINNAARDLIKHDEIIYKNNKQTVLEKKSDTSQHDNLNYNKKDRDYLDNIINKTN